MKYAFDAKQHLHTLDGVPLTGTSSVVGVLNKPLTWWASGKAVETLGWTNPKKFSEEERLMVADSKLKMITLFGGMVGQDGVKEYLNLLDTAYKAHATSLKESATAGTDLHAELEKFVKAEMGIWNYEVEDLDERIQPFIEWSKQNVEKFLYSEAHCFDEELFIGGISDAGALLKDGRIAVIDFKSSKEAYPSAFLQVAGYAIQIDRNGLWYEGGRVNKKLDKKVEALIVVPFGAEKIEPQIRYEIEEYKDGFRHAVALYRLLGLDKRVAEETKNV